MPDLSTTLCVSDAAATITGMTDIASHPVFAALSPEARETIASSAPFDCGTCYDTRTIDQGGAEIACPACSVVPPVSIKIKGLGHGMGQRGAEYTTASAWNGSAIWFEGSRTAILADVRRVRAAAQRAAYLAGETGRTSTSSWAIAIERRVVAELARS